MKKKMQRRTRSKAPRLTQRAEELLREIDSKSTRDFVRSQILGNFTGPEEQVHETLRIMKHVQGSEFREGEALKASKAILARKSFRARKPSPHGLMAQEAGRIQSEESEYAPYDDRKTPDSLLGLIDGKVPTFVPQPINETFAPISLAADVMGQIRAQEKCRKDAHLLIEIKDHQVVSAHELTPKPPAPKVPWYSKLLFWRKRDRT